MSFTVRTSLRRLGIAGLAVAILAGCQSSLPAHYDGMEKTARNEVSMIRLAHLIDAGQDGLKDEDKTDIVRFLSEMDASYGDSVTLVRGAQFSDKAADDVGRIVRAHGLVLDMPAAEIGHQPSADGAVLVLDRYIVTSPQCPGSVLNVTKNPTNAASPYIGCANVINLGQMVASPRDLLAGNGDGNPSVGKAVQSIRAWRDAPPVILVPQGTKGGGRSGR